MVDIAFTFSSNVPFKDAAGTIVALPEYDATFTPNTAMTTLEYNALKNDTVSESDWLFAEPTPRGIIP